MVVSAHLSDPDWPELTEVFNHAFGDYDIPLSLTEEQLKSHMDAVSFSKTDSMGLFDEGTLVGFLFVGRRGTHAWDGGTAIIPSYRGRGLAHTLVKETIAHLKKMGCTSFLLEVLKTNERAIKLYRAHGFEVRRTLFCYKHSCSDVRQNSSSLTLAEEKRPFDAINPFEPSWQNANDSINIGSYTHATIKDNGTIIGSAAYNKSTGSIAQIVLNPPFHTTDYLKETIITVAHHLSGNEVRMINVDGEDTKLQQAFEALGFELFTTQYEMERVL
ncbi:MAG: GNAT family N-acetyltransferase [Sphaerochaeta sp.]|jgi:ribosomal protein S18 acetylase RimI-like enzyme